MAILILAVIACLILLLYRFILVPRTKGSATRLKPNTLYLRGIGAYTYKVKGTSHYQEALAAICGGHGEESADKKIQAILVHEDDNPYDPNNAIRIDIQGKRVGHLAKTDAKKYRRLLAEAGHAGKDAVCSAKIIGGWQDDDGWKASFGLRLDLSLDAGLFGDSLPAVKNDGGKYEFDVANFYYDDVEDLRPKQRVRFFKPPDNTAIMIRVVFSDLDEKKVGYVPDTHHGIIAKHIDKNRPYSAYIKEVGTNNVRIACDLDRRRTRSRGSSNAA